MSVFDTEEKALKFIKEHVPAKPDDKKINLEKLKEPLFEASKDIPPGEYEFEGEHGFKVSFEFIRSSGRFDACYTIFGNVSSIEGKYQPTNFFRSLNIQTKNFQYDLKDYKGGVNIIWLPNLKDENSELSNSFLSTASRSIYLIDKDGLFSRPIGLLGYFHELGHLVTGSGGPISVLGMRVNSAQSNAKELKDEYDANEWVRENTKKLFKDLDLPNAIEDYTRLQIRSYHRRLRRLYLED